MLKRLFCLGAILASVTLSTTAVAQRTPHIVFMIGEDEYHTWETLPDFAKRELEPKGYQVTIIQQDEKDKNKTSKELFVEAIDTVIGLVSDDKKLSSTFVGKKYIPFMREMKAKGYVEPFAYMVLYLSGDTTTKPWLAANDTKLSEFLKWADAYRPAK